MVSTVQVQMPAATGDPDNYPMHGKEIPGIEVTLASSISGCVNML